MSSAIKLRRRPRGLGPWVQHFLISALCWNMIMILCKVRRNSPVCTRCCSKMLRELIKVHFQCLKLQISHRPRCKVLSPAETNRVFSHILVLSRTPQLVWLVGSHQNMTQCVLRWRRCGWHCQSAVEPSETVEVSSVGTLIGPPAPLLVLSAVQSHSESVTVRQILTTVKRTYYRW